MITGPACCEDGIRGAGNPDYGIMIVGQFPNYTELQTGLPFTGQDGALLDSVLQACGWSRDKVYCTNSCCVRDLSRIDICRPRLLKEIELYKPKLVITLGSIACSNLFGMSIGKCRGALLYQQGYRGLATWLPSAILQSETAEKQNDFAAEFVRDLKKIYRYFRPGVTPPERVTTPHITVSNVQEAQHILDTLPRGELVTIDIETPIIDKEAKEADPYSRILCVGVGLDNDVQYIFPEEIISQLDWPKDVMWGGWNLYGFDMVALRDKYNIILPVVHDGMITSYVRDERTTKGLHKLKNNAREDAGSDWYEQDDIRDSEYNLHKYNGFDIAYNYRLLKYHLDSFDSDDKRLYYDLLIPAANMYSEAQYEGFTIDVWKLFRLNFQFLSQASAMFKELCVSASEYGYPGEINPNSDVQVSHFFFDILGFDPKEYSHLTKGGKWSVDKNVLDNINHPWAAKLRLHRQVSDTRTRYLEGVNAQVKHDLKVHAKCWIPGTTSGRPSYSDPPMQQLPHRRTIGEFARVREIFTVDDSDHILMALDYSQGELYILYGFSGDKNLLADLTEPWYVTNKPDYHSRTSSGVPCPEHSIVCDECYLSLSMCACLGGFTLHHADNCAACLAWEYARDNQKHVNFGIPYGETAHGLRRPPPIGTGLPLVQCQALITAWYARNKDVYAWQRSIEYILNTTGFIKLPSGRKRRFPLVVNPKQVRQAINAPIQGTLSDYTMSSAVEMMPQVRALGGRLLLTTHDEILLHVPRSHEKEIATYAKQVMMQARYPGFPVIPVEIKTGSNLWEVSP